MMTIMCLSELSIREDVRARMCFHKVAIHE